MVNIKAGACKNHLYSVANPSSAGVLERYQMCTHDSLTTSNVLFCCRLLGERAETVRGDYEGELDSIASRLATALASLHDSPAIRYKAGKPPEPGDAPGASARSVLTQKLAQKVSERAMVLQRNGVLPPRETCDLLILDRTVDPVAPVIHEWTYEAMVYDLLPVEDNVIRFNAETAAGKSESKEHMLDDATDELWAELRHAHIADVYTTLSKRMTEFQDKNKAAKYQTGKGGVPPAGGMSTTNIKALIQALPQFRDVLSKLSMHIFISSELKTVLNSRNLTDVGGLEQDLVYGDKNSQDLIKYLADNSANLDPSDKMRLFMAYIATHPEKLDPVKRQQWQKVARLDSQDMSTVCNLAFLNVAVMKQPGSQAKSSMGFTFKPKKKKATYRKREGREEQYALSRFDPVLLDVLEDALGNKLSQEEYPYVRSPDEGDDFGANEATRIASARTNKSAISWARKDASTTGPQSSGISSMLQGLGLGTSSQGGRRLLVFVIGGVTRSEMRAVHEVAKKTGRDVLLGSTAVLKPAGFLSQLRSMGTAVAE
eukprot:GHUV01018943.1.p1 GENE.GHUV01018943.1~~GHUV01018943.1.p1  ORF type:complete len:543 (+),score=157.47 GHUV01018943.1:1151-2779(+)